MGLGKRAARLVSSTTWKGMLHVNSLNAKSMKRAKSVARTS